MSSSVSASDVEKAHAVIRDGITHTPVSFSRNLSKACGCEIYLKLETLHVTGAFKERGALNRLLALSEAERACGVITASAGNHGQGVAYHATRLGINSKVVMPERSPLRKVVATERFGAQTVLHGTSWDDAQRVCLQLANDEGRVVIHPFDDPLVIAGQGTLALEALQDRRVFGAGAGSSRDAPYDAIICSIGGGGLIGGVAAYVCERFPRVQVVGVEASTCPAMRDSVAAGRVVELKSASSLADGIAVRRVGELNLEIVQRCVEDIYTVEEDDIAHAILQLLENERIVVEGAGAATLAAVWRNRARFAGKKVLLVLSGGNMDVNTLHRVITRGLGVERRVAQVKVRMQDIAGSMIKPMGIIAALKTNVLDIEYHRFGVSDTPFGQVDATFTIEIRGAEHIAQIETALRNDGFLVD